MAETIFKSPGVSTREIDLTGPTSTTPTGIPAGVIGTSEQGPAFVPVTVATFADFVAKFGGVSADRFGPLAIQQWLRNRNAGLFIRTLGAGNGKKRNADGTVTNAGFVVGQQLPLPDTANAGNYGDNPYAGSTTNGAKATVDITSTLLAFSDGARFTINVPVSQGGENGTVEIRYKDGVVSKADNRITIRRDAGGAAASAENLAALLVFAINGVAPSGAGPTGGTFVASDIAVANDGTRGVTGVDGITASRAGAVVTITCDTIGDDGNEVVLTDTNATPITGSPKSLAGGQNGNGFLGRSWMLACAMSGSAGSNFMSDSGLSTTLNEALVSSGDDLAAFPMNAAGAAVNQHVLLRGILLAASGVVPALSASRPADGNWSGNNVALGSSKARELAGSNVFGDDFSDNAGSTRGAVNISSGKQEFVLLLNGHTHTAANPTILTASFDPQAPNYMANVLNTDPQKVQTAGHCLYADFPVYSAMAVITGSSFMSKVITSDAVGMAGRSIDTRLGVENEDVAFLVTSSLGRNAGSATKPNYENFVTRFTTAVSPFVVSQEFGGTRQNLFRVHSLDDGAIGNAKVKISIENIQKSNNKVAPFGQFDLIVRDFSDSDSNPVALEKFTRLSLDPNSERYVPRVIGDQHMHYDFDKAVGAQKLVIDGAYPNASSYIRVETSKNLEDGVVDPTALPVGFRGVQHLVTSGSSIFSTPVEGFIEDGFNPANQITEPPIPFRRSLSTGKGKKKKINSSLYWGVQWEMIDSVEQPNRNVAHDPIVAAYTKWAPNHLTDVQAALVGNNEGKLDNAGTIYDADRFNNDLFSLEKIQVITSTSDKAAPAQWAAAKYRRNGVATADLLDIDGNSSISTRLLDVEKDFGQASARRFLKFTFPLQGGFDGLNILDKQKALMSDTAARREMTDSTAQGGTDGSTVASFRKAVDILGTKADADINLLAIPGMRHESITDYALQATEERFDALYLMDLEEKDNLDSFVTGSKQDINVTNTVNTFQLRNMDSSFGAVYFPDVLYRDDNSGQVLRVPPTVTVLGAFGLNDSVAHPWFAPAGFTRGSLRNVQEAQVKLSRGNMDALYENDINPLASFPSSPGTVVFGQKTLLAGQSALDRVNVRRLLIDIRRKVKKIGDTFLFEPNRESTLSAFSAAVEPILSRIQQQQGLEKFKVQIDTSTTTQADVENNTVRGKIFLQPVRSVEFISLDFVVTNAGMDI